MHAPMVDPTVIVTDDALAELCDADRHARRFAGRGDAGSGRARIRVYGLALPAPLADDEVDE